ncbi:hypothetical protein GCM10022197_32340 [Microlunatus spumicola]|uniref:DUF4157 domain-containing protein n=1 Tax=Microlunatus spumicola TaxID=81499 RepID=A0ABP6XVR0_9ACTN
MGHEPPVVEAGVASGLCRAQRARRLANLLNLSTPLGLAVARAGGARRRPGPYGLVLAEGYGFRFPVAGAFTVGDVIVTASTFDALLRRHPGLLAHEERHSRQYAVFLGLPYLPLYTLAMAWSVVRTGDRSSRNVFERHAGLLAGGYVERPAQPLTATLSGAVNLLRTRRSPRR